MDNHHWLMICVWSYLKKKGRIGVGLFIHMKSLCPYKTLCRCIFPSLTYFTSGLMSLCVLHSGWQLLQSHTVLVPHQSPQHHNRKECFYASQKSAHFTLSLINVFGEHRTGNSFCFWPIYFQFEKRM